MIATTLYKIREFVLKDPIIVANAHILDHNTPLGYLPKRRFLKVDLNKLKASPVGFDNKSIRPWYIIPTQYKYYNGVWHPALSVSMKFDKDAKFIGGGSSGWNMHLDAVKNLLDWSVQHARDLVDPLTRILHLLNNIDSTTQRLVDSLQLSGIVRSSKSGSLDSKDLIRLLSSQWVIVWDDQFLSDDPRVIEWQRMHFALNGYGGRKEVSARSKVEYRDGRVYINPGMGVEFTSILTGEKITDPCIYMVPTLSNDYNTEQLLSFYSPQFSSYGLASNLNAPMGLDESWWLAATASVVFLDPRFSATLSNEFSLSFLPLAMTHGINPVQDDLEDLGIELTWIEDAEEESAEDDKPTLTLDPTTRSAHRIAVETAHQFSQNTDYRPNTSEDVSLIVMLRQYQQGRSSIRYYVQLPVGSRTDTSHNTARGRFHHLKDALRLTTINTDSPTNTNTLVVGLKNIITMVRELYGEEIPASCYTDLWRCSFENRPYPSRLVFRVATAVAKWLSHGKDVKKQSLKTKLSSRMVISAIAFLKAHLYFSGYEVNEELDYHCKDPWYNFGRAVAICQWFQRQSLGDDKRTNIENVLASIQSSPSRVIGFVFQSVVPHLDKLERDKPEEYNRLMLEFGFSLDPIKPENLKTTSRLDHNQLALVMLGYFQQLTTLFRKKRGNNAKEDSNDR